MPINQLHAARIQARLLQQGAPRISGDRVARRVGKPVPLANTSTGFGP
jgi:hypothetical protein